MQIMEADIVAVCYRLSYEKYLEPWVSTFPRGVLTTTVLILTNIRHAVLYYVHCPRGMRFHYFSRHQLVA